MLPANPQNVQLILELNAAASQYGMVLQNVKIDASTDTPTIPGRPGPGGQSPDVGNLTITFSVAGPYNGFTNFIKTIEKSLRIIDIQKATFTATDPKSTNYQYTVAVKTYWLK
jgi:Tfp pilus assembly protein PilO